MDCHRCIYLRYDGCPYGRCSHSGHSDVRFSKEDLKKRASEGTRTYNKMICPDFKMKRRCSNCRYWVRGEYFADGKTPAKKGRCSLRVVVPGDKCPIWEQGKTSWKKRSR